MFRPEAIAAQRQQWLGPVQLVRPLALSWLTAGAVCALLALGAFVSLAQYTRKATVAGVLVPDRGLIRLVPSVSGTVVERRAAEGQPVRAGDVLFVLDLDRPTFGAEAQAQVSRSLDERRRSLREAVQAARALAQSRQGELERRQSSLAGELAQFDIEARLQQQRLALAQQALARLQSLQADHFISPAQVQAKSDEVLGLQAAAQTLARQRAALLRERDTLAGEQRDLPLQTEGRVGSLERDLAQVERDAAEQGAPQQVVVRAPQSGTVSTVLAEVGQSVSPAAALATLVPSGARLQAQLYAPSSAVGFVRTGQAVRLRYEAFPYQEFGQQPGHVLQVSRTPLAANELAALALPAVGAGSEPLFRITVALDPAPRAAMPLAAGMRLQADVMLDRRRLVQWLFEPLLGLRSRL
ncbi:MAG: HlyD family efflux transporter periplasmic adaptor subunit [Burkholderiales bacterium]|nr:HlyD family efflux transporter periplasmic adaptor subunit [Burkholderiales bacterium]MDE2564762.1 HlyD family efflux transporter periplasmic adaptor subunit [Burkholderiales bacterium]